MRTDRTIIVVRIFFILLCAVASGLIAWVVSDWTPIWPIVVAVGLLIGALVILVDLLLKGFTLRGLTAVAFGLAVGALVSWLLGSSPIFSKGDEQVIYLSRMALFVICMYLGTVMALRGKDDFNFVIPYMRFVPHEVDVPLIIVDSSALIDGRIVKLCESHFISAGLIIPQFVLSDLQRIADSPEPARKTRGRRGLDTLNQLRGIKGIDLRIHESEVASRQEGESKIVFLAQSMKAKLLTTDFNLARVAEFHGVTWLNLNSLAKALRPEIVLGESFEVELVKPGREDGQAVGYVEDGSMVVVSDGRPQLGKRVAVEVVSIIPSAGGKMIFAKLQGGAGGGPGAPQGAGPVNGPGH